MLVRNMLMANLMPCFVYKNIEFGLFMMCVFIFSLGPSEAAAKYASTRECTL